MTMPLEVETEIRRLHEAERWSIGTIASQLGVHEDVVRRVLGLSEPRSRVVSERGLRPRLVGPYIPFIEETLRQYPRLRATRLFDMVRARGYPGGVRTLRNYVATVRPRPKREAYLRINVLPGEQAQVDWAHVGRVKVPGGERVLWLFVMVLAYSRAMWGEFVFDLSTHSLLRSLVRAGEFFGGSARQWLFDNPKMVVLERYGDASRFHPLLLELSGHYRAQLRLCQVRKANEKGRVERAIRFLRDRFLAGRNIHSIAQGNRELLSFITDIANPRSHPTQPGKTVAQAFEEEKKYLLPLPASPVTTEQIQPVNVDKTAFVRFDTNSYSVPPEYAQSTLVLAADDVSLRLLDKEKEIARHSRSWGRRQIIENPEHRKQVLEEKRNAKTSVGRNRLKAASPRINVLFERWVEAGRSARSLTAQTVQLLNLYGDSLFAEAVEEAISRGTHDPGALAMICETNRKARNRPIPIEVQLGSHVLDRDVVPHSLEAYDAKRK